MRLGSNIRRYRETKGWSQEALARSIEGMSQSSISRIESNEQDLSWEQIESFAKAFNIDVQELVNQAAPIFHNHNQQGGNASNYIVQNGSELALAAKDEVISAKNDIIAALKGRIASLEKEMGALRNK